MRKLALDDIILSFGLIDRIQRDVAGNNMSYFICKATVEIAKKEMNKKWKLRKQQ